MKRKIAIILIILITAIIFLFSSCGDSSSDGNGSGDDDDDGAAPNTIVLSIDGGANETFSTGQILASMSSTQITVDYTDFTSTEINFQIQIYGITAGTYGIYAGEARSDFTDFRTDPDSYYQAVSGIYGCDGTVTVTSTGTAAGDYVVGTFDITYNKTGIETINVKGSFNVQRIN